MKQTAPVTSVFIHENHNTRKERAYIPKEIPSFLYMQKFSCVRDQDQHSI